MWIFTSISEWNEVSKKNSVWKESVIEGKSKTKNVMTGNAVKCQEHIWRAVIASLPVMDLKLDFSYFDFSHRYIFPVHVFFSSSER